MSQGPTTHKFVIVAPTEPKPRRVRGSTACTRCHRLKVKCVPSPQGEACARCAKTPQASECSIRLANIMANSCTSPESTSSSIDSSPTQHDSGLLLSDGAYDSYLTNYPMENYVDPSGKTHETFMYVPGGASEQMAPTYPSSSYHHPSSQIYPPASIQYSPASSAYSSSTQYSAPQWDSDQDIKPFLSPDLAERLEYAPYQTIHGDPQTPQNQSGYSPVVAHSSWQAGGYTYQ